MRPWVGTEGKGIRKSLFLCVAGQHMLRRTDLRIYKLRTMTMLLGNFLEYWYLLLEWDGLGNLWWIQASSIPLFLGNFLSFLGFSSLRDHIKWNFQSLEWYIAPSEGSLLSRSGMFYSEHNTTIWSTTTWSINVTTFHTMYHLKHYHLVHSHNEGKWVIAFQ